MAVQIPFPLPATGYALNSKVRVNLDFLVDQFNQFNSGTATWDNVSIGTANSLTGTLTFYNASNANYLTIKAGATSPSYTLTLPTGAPSVNNAFLQSSTAGVMSWSTLSWNITGVDNGVMYVPAGGTTVDTLANGTGTTAILIGASSGTPKWVQLLPTSNQTTVTFNSDDVTLGTVQDIGTSSTVVFGRMRVAAGSYSSPGFYFTSSTGNTVGWFAESNGTAIYLRAGGAFDSTVFAADSTGLVIASGSGSEFRASSIRALSALKVSTSSGIVSIQSTGSTTWTLTLPPDGGTVDYVLRTDGSGTTSWVSIGSTGGATKALDNLVSVAINTTLVSDTNNTDDLGTTSINWRSLYIATSIKNGATTLATVTELGYLTGVSSAIQTQLGTKASTALSNLASVAINTTLVSDANNTDDLGTSSIRWKTTYLSTSLDISATSNQIVLGTTRTVTITAGTPATSSRVWTIPDITADGTFAALEGTQTFSGTKTFSSDLTLSRSDAGNTVTYLVRNSDNTNGASNTRISIRVGGTSAGDPYIFFDNNSTDWSLGVDNSDSDKFELCRQTGVGSAIKMTWDSNGPIGIGTANPASYNTNADELVLANSGGVVGMTLRANTNSSCILAFTDAEGTTVQGLIQYDHNATATSELITIRVGGTDYLTLSGSGHLTPVGTTGTQNFGNASNYWNDISYKTLTDRGCLPWCDDGVELVDGRTVTDLDALCFIKKHPFEKTIHGLPKLDYRTFPKASYRPADKDGCLLLRDKHDMPIGGSDGVEMTMVFGVMIGAFKQIKTYMTTTDVEIEDLKKRIEVLEKSKGDSK
jgi:hypothetical protein